MSEDHVALVRRCYDAWARREWAETTTLVHPDFEMDMSRNVFNPAIHRGISGLEDQVAGMERVWAEFVVEPVEFEIVGDNVVVALAVRARGRGSGVGVDTQTFNVWRIQDGKVSAVVVGINDRDEAMELARSVP